MKKFTEELDAFATQFAAELQTNQKLKPAEKTKGLQALTSYYAARAKNEGKKPSDNGFASFKKLFDPETQPSPTTEENYDA